MLTVTVRLPLSIVISGEPLDSLTPTTRCYFSPRYMWEYQVFTSAGAGHYQFDLSRDGAPNSKQIWLNWDKNS
jgi:hypothetical protein